MTFVIRSLFGVSTTVLLLFSALSCQSVSTTSEKSRASQILRTPDSSKVVRSYINEFPVEQGNYDVLEGSGECTGGIVRWRHETGENPLLIVGTLLTFYNINQPEMVERSPRGSCETRTLTRLTRDKIDQRRIIDCKEPASFRIVHEVLTLIKSTQLGYEVFHQNSKDEEPVSVLKCIFTKAQS